MWVSPDIDDLNRFPPAKAVTGYALNIRSWLMAGDLQPYVVTPAAPARHWLDDAPKVVPTRAAPDAFRGERADFSGAAGCKPACATTVFLIFPSEEAARATSLGRLWKS